MSDNACPLPCSMASQEQKPASNVADSSSSPPASAASQQARSAASRSLEALEAARKNEISILSQVRHENIIGFTKLHDGSFLIEKLDTTLDKRIAESTQLTLFQKLSVARDIAQALTYLHGLARPVYHLNVQPSSIHLGCRPGVVAKLASFGVAGIKDEPTTIVGLRGAPLYNPPEALKHAIYNEKSDVYSYGLTMTEMIVGTAPFASVKSLANLLHAIEQPPSFPDDLPPAIADLLCRCRSVDPASRPCFPEILVSLNELFVPLFISENIEWARHFWQSHFAGEISVRWSDFLNHFIAALQLPCSASEVTFRGVQRSKDNAAGMAIRQLHCLKQLFFPGLADDHDFIKSINLWVDIDRFGHLFGLFSDEETRLENFLENLANLIEHKWFHGDASGSSGPHRLGPDTFLIRLSAPAQNSLKPPNCWFTFSLKASGGNFVRETRIQRQPGKSECVLANSARESYPSLFALVEEKSKLYAPAPVPSFLSITLHPIASEYTTDDEEQL